MLRLEPGEARESDKGPRIAGGGEPGFFRKPELFQALETTVLPQILAGKLGRDPIRAWVPGASTGEEVYSISICLTQVLGRQSGSRPIQIFGTDLSDEAIQKARAGTYSESTLLHVARDCLRRFFAKEGGVYRIATQIRDACFFARHDVTKDPPFSRLDLISCRGVLANLEPALQKKVLSTFHYALRDTGFLLLGELETPVDRDLFAMVDQNNRIFIKRPTKAEYEGAHTSPSLPQGEAAKDTEILRLRGELARTRSYFQAVIEQNESNAEQYRDVIHQHETTKAEMLSANEEARSAMEGLQCINEQLESTKEELQSSNEELLTLHRLALNHNFQLSKLSDDLTNILGSVNIPLVILGGDCRIRWATLGAENLLHVLPSDVGRPISDIRMAFTITDLDDLISTVLMEGRQLEREVRGENGRWYSVRIRPYRKADGRIDGALLALWDIHPLKESQEALRNQQRFLSSVLDAAGWTLLVIVLDPEGRIVHFNRACQVLTGYSLEEVRGRRPWDFLPQPQEPGGFQAVFQHLTPMSTQEYQGHWVTKDGRSRLIAWYISVTADDGGGPQYVIGSGVDVTERQQAREQARHSEATVRALVETAAQGIIGISGVGAIVLANATAEAVFGYTGEEMLGQPIDNLLPPHLRPVRLRNLPAFLQPTQNGPMGKPLDLTGARKDGTEFPVEVSLSRVVTGEGILAVAFITDITERKRNEGVLRQSEAAARASQKQLRELMAGLLEAQEEERRRVSRELHDDLNQKLAMLAVELGSIEAGLPQSEAVIRGQLQCVEKRVNSLSDDVRRTAYQLHPSTLEHLGLVAALETYCSEFSGQEKIKIGFRLRKVPGAVPKGVALCLYRVVQEALHNIAKHSGAARACVTLAGMGDRLVLTVEDQGRGFDPAVIDGKRGLGLVSMKERVVAAGGLLTIDTQAGGGTRVRVQIPLKGGSE
jgi:PAS domain S-box-containing protein